MNAPRLVSISQLLLSLSLEADSNLPHSCGRGWTCIWLFSVSISQLIHLENPNCFVDWRRISLFTIGNADKITNIELSLQLKFSTQ